MKNTTDYRVVLGALALFAISIVGCSESFSSVPVSGTVTLDGEPLAGVLVTFEPQAIEGGTANVGPFSFATTDSAGKYTLETRYGDPGAVVGNHKVSFVYGDIDEEAIADAESDAAEAKAEGEKLSAEEKAAAKAANAQLGKRKRIPKRYGEDGNVTIEVPAGGLPDANFELTSK